MEINDIQKQLDSIRRTVNKYGKNIEEIEKDVAILRKDSHPPIKYLERRLRKLEKKQGD